MNRMTEANLEETFAVESQGRTRYREFARAAREEGYTNVARLFEATAFSQEVLAARSLHALQGVSSTSQNLREALSAELYDVEQMYPAFIEVADLQEERVAQRNLQWSLEAERDHVNLYQEALGATDSGRDVELMAVFVCPVCGYTAKDQPPETCPLSGTPGREFRGF